MNENEARAFLGPVAAAPRALGARLAALGIIRLVITRGAEPTLAITGDTVAVVPTLPVTPVDTVGAGDTFAGACAAHLAAGCGFEEALLSANAAGAAATLKPGAQEAMPTRRLVQRLLRRQTDLLVEDLLKFSKSFPWPDKLVEPGIGRPKARTRPPEKNTIKRGCFVLVMRKLKEPQK